jgi:hypothetical protein
MNYLILCRVSGGVTGTRESFLKLGDTVRVFSNKEEAEGESKRFNALMNGPYAKAHFQYTVVEEN